MFSTAHRKAIIAILTAVAALCTAVVGLINSSSSSTSRQHVTNVAQGNLKKRAVQATAAAQLTPVVACNPEPGGAKLGACAPVQALAGAAELAKAAGDPYHVSGRPLGVDTSSYQPCGYSLAGLEFAAFKATEGTRYTDRCLRANVARAKRERKPYTVYDFLRPSFAHSATAEANHFVSAVRGAGANTSLPPTADVEANAGLNTASLQRYVCTWHSVVARALHRNVTITYTGGWFWRLPGQCGSLLWDSAYATCYITPLAWAGHGPSTFGSCSGRRGGAIIWQYSNGRDGPTPHLHGWDSDVWLGSRASLASLAHAAPPVTSRARALCGELQHYNRERAADRAHPLKGRKRFPPAKAARFVAIRKALATRYVCGHHGRAVVIRRR